MTRAIVIGGGVAGLATAALLAADGLQVELHEARNELGGRAGTWEQDGFRFDTGPSWYLMPEVFEHYFRLLGTTAADELDLVRLNPAYRVFSEGHDPLAEYSGSWRPGCRVSGGRGWRVWGPGLVTVGSKGPGPAWEGRVS